MTRPMRENCTHSSCGNRTPKYALLFDLFPLFHFREHAANPASATQHPGAPFRDETGCADRDPRGNCRTPTYGPLPPAACLVGPLGLPPFSLPMVERTLAEMEGGGSGATGGRLGRRGRAGAMQHAALQGFFKIPLNLKDRAASPSTSR